MSPATVEHAPPRIAHRTSGVATRRAFAAVALALACSPALAAAQVIRTPSESPEAPAQQAPTPESAPAPAPAPAPEAAPAAPKSPPAAPARAGHVEGWNITLSDGARRGAKIESIDGSSPAAAMLHPGDVVLRAGDAPIHDSAELARVLGAVPVGSPVLLDVLRAGAVRSIGIQIPPEPGAAAAADVSSAPSAPSSPSRPTGSRAATPAATLYPDVPAIPAPAPEVKQPMVVVVPSGGGSLVFGGGGGTETLTAVNPPAYSGPGLSIIPGATFAPGPGSQATAAPQIPGISQPNGFQVQLGATPIAGPAGGPAPTAGNATTTTTGSTPGFSGSGTGSVPVRGGVTTGGGGVGVGSSALMGGGRGGH